MAIEKTILEIIFQGVDNVSSTMGTIGSSTINLSRSVDALVKPFKELADGVLKTDAALVALATGGLAYSFLKSSELETALIDLSKVAGGDLTMSLDQMKTKAGEMADRFGVSTPQIIEGISGWAQAGFSAAEATDILTKSTLDLSIAGGVTVPNATEILISVLKGFKLEAKDTAQVVDVLNKVSDKTATDTQQLGNAMAGISPIAKLMGFSIAETTGVVTPIIETFRSGSEAANALKTGLLKLVDDSKPVQDALKALGVSQKDVNETMRSGKDIMRSGKDIFYDVAKAFTTVGESQKVVFASQLFGVEQAGRLLEVFNNLPKVMEITEIANDEYSASLRGNGSALEEVEKRLASAEIAMNRVKVSFENLAAAAGDQFKSAIVGSINGVSELEKSFTKVLSSGALEPVFSLLRQLFDDFGNDLTKIAKLLPEVFKDIDFSKFTLAFQSVRAEISKMFDIDLTTPEGLRSTIQAVVDSIASLMNVSVGMGKQWEPVIASIKLLGSGFINLSSSVQEGVGRFLGLSQQTGNITGWLAKIGLIAKPLEDFGKTAQVTGLSVEELSGKIDKYGESFSLSAKDTEKASESLKNSGKVVTDTFSKVITSFQEIKEGSGMGDYFKVIGKSMAEFLNVDTSNLEKALKNIGETISKVFGVVSDTSIWKGFAQTGVNALTTIIELCQSLINVGVGIAAGFKLQIDIVLGLLYVFNELPQAVQIVAGAFASFAITGKTLGFSFKEMFDGLKFGFETLKNGVSVIKDDINSLKDGLNGLDISKKSLADKVGMGALAFSVGYAFGSLLNELEIVKKSAQYTWELLDKAFNFTGTSGKTSADIEKDIKRIQEEGNARLKANKEAFQKEMEQQEEERRTGDNEQKILDAKSEAFTIDVESGKTLKQDIYSIIQAAGIGLPPIKIKLDVEEGGGLIDKINKASSGVSDSFSNLFSSLTDINLTPVEEKFVTAGGNISDIFNKIVGGFSFDDVEIVSDKKIAESVEKASPYLEKLGEAGKAAAGSVVGLYDTIKGFSWTDKIERENEARRIALSQLESEKKAFESVKTTIGEHDFDGVITEFEKLGGVIKNGVKYYEDFGSSINYVEGELVSYNKTVEESFAEIDKLNAFYEDNPLTPKVDVDTAIENLDKYKASMSSLDETTKKVGDNISSLFETMGKETDFAARSKIESQIQKENRAREEAAKLQKELIDQQIQMNDLKMEKLREFGKEELIKITIDPALEPDLDAVVRKIIERAQVIGTASGVAALIGV